MSLKTKQNGYQILADVTGDKRFFCHDGCISRNLSELSDCFARMTQDIYNYHVTGQKNDFSNWINDVLGDTKLAADLMNLVSPSEAARVTRARILLLRRSA
jgi:hypothetical protein